MQPVASGHPCMCMHAFDNRPAYMLTRCFRVFAVHSIHRLQALRKPERHILRVSGFFLRRVRHLAIRLSHLLEPRGMCFDRSGPPWSVNNNYSNTIVASLQWLWVVMLAAGELMVESVEQLSVGSCSAAVKIEHLLPGTTVFLAQAEYQKTYAIRRRSETSITPRAV